MCILYGMLLYIFDNLFFEELIVIVKDLFLKCFFKIVVKEVVEIYE